MIATIIEIWNDRHGDLNKADDIWFRVPLLFIDAVILYYLNNKNIFICFNLSAAIFFLTFDYSIAYILIKNGTIEPPRGIKYSWFTYVAKKGFVDNVPNWTDCNPWIKLGIRACYFTSALILYFIK